MAFSEHTGNQAVAILGYGLNHQEISMADNSIIHKLTKAEQALLNQIRSWTSKDDKREEYARWSGYHNSKQR